MKITINLNNKEITMIKTLAKKFKGQIIDPIKNQILLLVGHEVTDEKKERVKSRIRHTYENSMVITSENWNDGLAASLELKTDFLEKVFELASRIIDEAAPSMGAIMGATMVFAGFIKSSASKISSFVAKVKQDEEKGVIITNNIFCPNDHTVVNTLISKNRFGYCDHIAWITESSDELSFSEELKMVEMIEVAIESNDYSGLRSHYVANSFDNKEEALKWFKDHNKVSIEYNTVCHGNGWTVKDWGKEETEESAENKTENECEDEKTPSEKLCDAIRNYTPSSDEEWAMRELEEMIEQAKEAEFTGEPDKIKIIRDQFKAHYIKLKEKFRKLDDMDGELRVEKQKDRMNRIILDSTNYANRNDLKIDLI